LRSPGQALDPETRAFMEPRFGHDLINVRVHADNKAAESADLVNSLAYTVNEHIVFGAGQYNPQSVYGRKLLTHELVHTIQQSAHDNFVSTSKQLVRRSDDANEREEDVTSRMIVKSHARPTSLKALQSSRSATIQRAIMLRRQTEDGTSKEAKAQIDQARKILNSPNLTPEALKELQTRIAEAEAALSKYRATIDSSSLGMSPVLMTAQTGTYADIALYVAAGIAALVGWIFVDKASRTLDNRMAVESLAEALRRLGEAVRYVRPQPAPPREVPAPRPPGKVIPIESHPRFVPKAPQSSPQPETPPKPLGPDIFSLPEPKPKPKEKEDEDKKRDCRLVRRIIPRGNDPLSELFCSVVGFGSPSYDIYSRVGRAEIDALAGRTWYECKCGQLSLVRAAKVGKRWAKNALEGPNGLDERTRRQSRVAKHCHYLYHLVVANEEVAEFFRERYGDIKVVVVRWEPCE
jgi:hypothetical protein